MECCEFTKWGPADFPPNTFKRIIAVIPGSGSVIRGNYFHDGIGLGTRAFGRDILIVQNTFKQLSYPWIQNFTSGNVLGKYAAIKLHSSKNISVLENTFEKIGGHAIWYDGNSEESEISYNVGRDIAFGFVRLEACGAGFLVQHNWVRDFGVADPRQSTLQSPAYAAHMAGGVLYKGTGSARNVFRGNTAVSGTKAFPLQNRQGFSDRDLSARRTPANEISQPYGRLRNETGYAYPGQNLRWSDNNEFYGNRAVRTYSNGIYMDKSLDIAKTYQTSKWDCNKLAGAFLFNEVLGSLPVEYTLQEVKKFGFNVSPGDISAPFPRNAFAIMNRATDHALIVEQTRDLKKPSRSVFEVFVKDCRDPPTRWDYVGHISPSNPVVLSGEYCRCRSIFIRARSLDNTECIGASWFREVSLT